MPNQIGGRPAPNIRPLANRIAAIAIQRESIQVAADLKSKVQARVSSIFTSWIERKDAQMSISGKKFAITGASDLPLNFHPAAIGASAVFDTPNGAVVATGGNAKLPYCVALEPVAAMVPA